MIGMVEFKVSYFIDNELDGEIKHHLTHAKDEHGALKNAKEAITEPSVWPKTRMILVEPRNLEDKLHYLWGKRFPELPVPSLSNSELKKVLGLEKEWGVGLSEYRELLATNKDVPSKKTALPLWCVKFDDNGRREHRMCRLFFYASNKKEAAERAIEILGDEIWRIHSVFPINCVDEDAINKERWIIKYSSVRGEKVSHYHTYASCKDEATEEMEKILDGGEYHILSVELEKDAIPSKYFWKVTSFNGYRISIYNIHALCEEEAVEKAKMILGDELRVTKMIMAEPHSIVEALRITWDEHYPGRKFPDLPCVEIKEMLSPYYKER